MSAAPAVRRWYGAIAVIFAAVSVLGGVMNVRAEGRRLGDLTIVDIGGNYGPLSHGGSGTDFGIRLPNDATCLGDTAHDNWRLQSFVVPVNVEPGQLTYALSGPKGEGIFPLFDTYTHPVAQVPLRVNAGAGEAGLIDAFEPISFAVFTPTMLPPGTYRIGIACTLWRVTDRYWDTQIIVTTASSDKPGGFVWRAAGAPVSAGQSPSHTVWWLFGVGGLAVLGTAVLLRLRVRRPGARSTDSHPPLSGTLKEPA